MRETRFELAKGLTHKALNLAPLAARTPPQNFLVKSFIKNHLPLDQTLIIEDERLKTIPVEIARSQGDEAFISEGLKPGDRVITTRVIDPMENTKLTIF